MESYHEINGEPLAASSRLLHGVLRQRLGFQGVLVTDYMEIDRLHSFHRVAATAADAVELAIGGSAAPGYPLLRQRVSHVVIAQHTRSYTRPCELRAHTGTSIDVSMAPYLGNAFPSLLTGLVRRGRVSTRRVDSSVRRVLELKISLGLLDGPTAVACFQTGDCDGVDGRSAAAGDIDTATRRLIGSVGCAEDATLALEAARASVTLLHNVPPPPPRSAPPPPRSVPAAPPPLPLPPGEFPLEECTAYVHSYTGVAEGCGWTASWACPSSEQPGSSGRWAEPDATLGFFCCCIANASQIPLPTPRWAEGEAPLLPLSASMRRILVVGPGADSLGRLSGGWTAAWQGTLDDTTLRATASESAGGADATVDTAAPPLRTILEALRALAPAGAVVEHRTGCELRAGSPREQQADGCQPSTAAEELTRLAARSDVAVLCVSEDPFTEKPGDLDDLALDDGQVDLARALSSSGVPVVVVVVTGRPRILRGIEKLPGVGAVLQSFLPGPQGGTAIAEVVYGYAEPTGRLPLSWPDGRGSLFYPHWHPVSQQCDGEAHCGVAWPFGLGLSYSRVTYEHLAISSDALARTAARNGPAAEVRVTLTVRSSGSRPLNHSVLLFGAASYRRITPAAQELKAFRRVTLPPAPAALDVTFTLTADDFAYVGLFDEWVLEGGRYALWVDPTLRPSSADECIATSGQCIHLRVVGDCEGPSCPTPHDLQPDVRGVGYDVALLCVLLSWLGGIGCALGCGRSVACTGRCLQRVTLWARTTVLDAGQASPRPLLRGVRIRRSESKSAMLSASTRRSHQADSPTPRSDSPTAVCPIAPPDLFSHGSTGHELSGLSALTRPRRLSDSLHVDNIS